MNARTLRRAPAAVGTLLAGLLLILGSGWVVPASAHAALAGSDPKDGARLDAVPSRITLDYSEPMSAPAYVVVTGPDGERADQGKVKVEDATVSVAVDPAAGPGSYTVAFRAVSEDGHPVSGQLSFTVVSPEATAAPSAASSPSASAAGSGAAGTTDEASPSTTAQPPVASSTTSTSARSSSGAGDDGPLFGVGAVELGIGVLLLAAAAGLYVWSRRQRA